jgi:2-polyprenyl-3-methyl-5-hydroxy-6-metoxy-1,4-benzoquinol methylase
MLELRPRICPFGALLRYVKPESFVLDVGCGGGLFLGLAAALIPGVRGSGFDSSAPAIRAAQEMARRCGRPLDFEQLSVDQPWPDVEADAVALVDVLHHVPVLAQRQVFEAAALRVKPGGLLICKDMSDRSWLLAGMNRLHDLLLARQWIHYVPSSLVQTWARDAGLHLREYALARRYWYDHYWLIYEKKSVE